MPMQATEHRDFSGGENLADNRKVLRPDQVVLLENGIITGHNQTQKRLGMTYMPDSVQFPGRVDYLYPFRPNQNTLIWLVIADQKLSLADGTLLLNNLGPGPYSMAEFGGKVYLVDGTSFYVTDGTPEGSEEVELPDEDEATLTVIKRCTLLLTVRDRLWAAGDPEVPYAVYYSQPEKPTYFKEDDHWLYIGQHDSAPVNIFTEAYGGILVGKPTGFWRIMGDPAALETIEVQRIITSNGPTERCFASDGADLWYIHQKRVYMLRQKEQSVWEVPYAGYHHAPLHIESDWSKAVMTYFDGRIMHWFHHPDYEGDGNNLCSVADLRFTNEAERRYAAWSRFTNWPVSAVAQDGGSLWAGLENGYLVKLFDGTTDLGEPIPFRLHTPEYALGDTFLQKWFHAAHLEIAQTGLEPVRPTHEVVVGLRRQKNEWHEAFVAYGFDSNDDWNSGTHTDTKAEDGQLKQANPRTTVNRTEDSQADFEQGTLVGTKATIFGLELDTGNQSGYRIAPALDLTPVRVVGSSQVSWQTAQVYAWEFLVSSVSATVTSGNTYGMKFRLNKQVRLSKVGLEKSNTGTDEFHVRIYRVSDQAVVASSENVVFSGAGWHWTALEADLAADTEYMLAFYTLDGFGRRQTPGSGQWVSATVDGVQREYWDRGFSASGEAFPTTEQSNQGFAFGIEYVAEQPDSAPTVTVEASTDNGQTWAPLTNGGAILAPDTDVSGTSLLLKQNLALPSGETPPPILKRFDVTVSPQFPYTGEWQSPEIDLAPVGRYQGSALQIEAEEFDGEVAVYTRVSLDGGNTWSQYTRQLNGEPIAGLNQKDDLSNARFQIKVVLTTNSEGNDPSLSLVVALFGFRGSVQRRFQLRPRLRGTFIQHRIEDSSPENVTVLAVGEVWRPLRHLRPSETEGSIISN